MNVGRKRIAVCAGVIAGNGDLRLLGSGHERETSKPRPLSLRDVALRHARTRVGGVHAESLTRPNPDPTGALTAGASSCRFVPRPPNGYISEVRLRPARR
jgi:hypothetical protein